MNKGSSKAYIEYRKCKMIRDDLMALLEYKPSRKTEQNLWHIIPPGSYSFIAFKVQGTLQDARRTAGEIVDICRRDEFPESMSYEKLPFHLQRELKTSFLKLGITFGPDPIKPAIKQLEAGEKPTFPAKKKPRAYLNLDKVGKKKKGK